MRFLKPRLISQNKFFLLASILLYIGIFSYLSCKRYWAGFANEWEDIAWINNLYWNMIHGNWDVFYNNYISGTLVDFHPSIAIFVFPIFYALLPNIYFILLTPTIFIALTAWPLFKIAKSIWKNEQSALIVALAYLFYAPKHSIVFVEDQTLFIIPLLAWAFYCGLEGKLKLFFILNCLIAAAKTESVLYSSLLTFYFLWTYHKTQKFISLRKQFIFFVVWTIIYLGLELQINANNYLQTGERDFNLKNIYEILMLLGPLLFLPIRTLLILIALPSFTLLITKKFFLPQQAYYLAPMIVFLFIGFIVVLNHISKEKPKYFRGILAVSLILCVLSNWAPNLIGRYQLVTDQPYKKINNLTFIGRNNIFDAEFYRIDTKMETVKKIIPQILQSDSVSATGDLLPYIPPRKEIYEVFDPSNDYKNASYVLITKTYQGLGAGSYYWSKSGTEPFIDELKKNVRYKVLIDENNLVVFKRL